MQRLLTIPEGYERTFQPPKQYLRLLEELDQEVLYLYIIYYRDHLGNNN